MSKIPVVQLAIICILIVLIPSTENQRHNRNSRSSSQSEFRYSPSTRRRLRTSQSRMQAALLEARLRQIQRQGLSKNQQKTQGQSSDFANYGTGEVYHLKRTVGRMTATVRKMGLRVDQLERWKQTSEERMGKMEKLLEGLQKGSGRPEEVNDQSLSPTPCCARVEELHSIVLSLNQSIEKTKKSKQDDVEFQTIRVIPHTREPEPQALQTAPLKEERDYSVLMQKSLNNADAISNLTSALEDQEVTISEQKKLIESLQSKLLLQSEKVKSSAEKDTTQDELIDEIRRNMEQDMITTAAPVNISVVPMATKEELSDLKALFEDQDRVVSRLYTRVGTTQRCCRRLGYLTGKVGQLERKTKETRTRADNAIRGLRGETRKIQALTATVEAQKTATKRMEDDLIDRDRIAAQSNQRFIELMQTTKNDLNSTTKSLQKALTRFRSMATMKMKNLNNLLEDESKKVVALEDKFTSLIQDIGEIRNESGKETERMMNVTNTLSDKIENEIKDNIYMLWKKTTELDYNVSDVRVRTRWVTDRLTVMMPAATEMQVMGMWTNKTLKIFIDEVLQYKQILTEMVTDTQTEMTEAVSSVQSCCDSTAKDVDTLNVTLESHQKHLKTSIEEMVGDNRQQELILTELREKSSNLEAKQVEILSKTVTIDEFTKAETKIEQNIGRIAQIGSQISNVTKTTSIMTANFDNKLEELKEAMFTETNEKLEKLNQTIIDSQSMFVNISRDISSNSERISRNDERLKDVETKNEQNLIDIENNKENIELANRSANANLLELRKSLLKIQSAVDTLGTNITKSIESMQEFSLAIVIESEGKISKKQLRADERLQALERANFSIRTDLNQCFAQLTAVEEGLVELRNADDVVSEALSTYEKALSEHDHLHRNLSVLNAEVQDAMLEQEVTLEKIGAVMTRLNQSFVEGQEVIDDSFTEKLLKQQEELSAVRDVMRNFSALITKVAKSQTTRDISQASLKTRQESISEQLQSLDQRILDATTVSGLNSEKIEELARNLSLNNKEIQKASQDRKGHEGDLLTLQAALSRISEESNKLKEQQISSFTDVWLSISSLQQSTIDTKQKIDNITKMQPPRDEMIKKLHEKLDKDLSKVSKSLESCNTSVVEIRDEIGELEAKTSLLPSTTESLKMLDKLMGELKNESNVHQRRLDAILDDMLPIQKDLSNQSKTINTLYNTLSNEVEFSSNMNNRLQILNSSILSAQAATANVAKCCERNNDTINAQKKTIMDLSTWATELSDKNSNNEKAIVEVADSQRRQDEQSKHMQQTITKQEVVIQSLNDKRELVEVELADLEKKSEIQSKRLDYLTESTSNISELVATIQDDILQQTNKVDTIQAGIQTLGNRVDSDKIDNEASISELNYTQQTMVDTVYDLYYNVSILEENVSYMNHEIEGNFNSTQTAFVLIEEQAASMMALRTDTNALISSIASSVASLEYSLEELNITLGYRVTDLDELLMEFQLAFDTSNRQLAHFIDELEITKANISNQLGFYTTSIDFLTQIVRESNEAVNENTERIKMLNETQLFFRLSIPALIATGVDEGYFEITNSTTDNDLFNLEDLAQEYYRQGDQVIQEVQEGNGDGISEEELRDRELDAIITGESDDLRAQRHVASWMSLERRKRVIEDVMMMNSKMSNVLHQVNRLQETVYEIGNATLPATPLPTASKPKGSTEDRVTFSAGLTENYPCCGTVVFGKVFVNVGNGYNSKSGHFTAPREGVYIFIASVSERDKFVNAAIVMNGMALVTMRMDHNSGNYDQSQSGNSVVIPLKTGDRVWVQTFSGSLLGYQSPAVTFTGIKIA